MRVSTRQRDLANVLLGTYLIFSPWLLGTSRDVTTSSNAWIVGAYLVAVAVLGLVVPGARVTEWAKIALGSWLLVAPFVLGLERAVDSWNAWFVGASVVASVGVTRITLGLAILLRWISLRYRARRLSPEKIVGYEGSEEPTSPERLYCQIAERSEQIHWALRKVPSEVEAEMCALGYQAGVNDLITLASLVDEELPKAGIVRRLRLKAIRRLAANLLSRTRGELLSGTSTPSHR